MTSSPTSPLILGGHTFISQLGNDAPATESEQCAIVEACLDRGIRTIDTTYAPERIALGRILESLGRHDEAAIFAWNFFTDFSADAPLPEDERYRPHHIDEILEQLRTTYVDCLVLIPSDVAEENRRQIDLLTDWKRKGLVRDLGLWVREIETALTYRDAPFRYALRPFNVAEIDGAPVLAACKSSGWETIATSPFNRGWELERIASALPGPATSDDGYGKEALADLMLRFTVHHPDVDRTIVAMRKPDWVERNLESVARGALTFTEKRRLRRRQRIADPYPSWWRRAIGRLW
jgi:aryl-alcohol dehydrogenase-like predicted oxidoreductase